MTLAHYIKGQEPPKPSFEPVTMPSVFDAMVELYPSPQTLRQYDRTTLRLVAVALVIIVALGSLWYVVLTAKPGA